MNEQRSHFALISMCSKSLDVINTYEACHRFNIKFSECLIIIVGDQSATCHLTEGLEADNIRYLHVPEHDLFAKLSDRFFNLRSGTNAKKIFTILFSYLVQSSYRTFKLRSWRRILNSISCTTLMLDLWRTKVPVLNYLHFEELVVMDGGTSTKNLKLLQIWESSKNAQSVLTKYLDNQKYYLRDRRGIQSRFQGAIYAIHYNTLYGLPQHMLNELKEKWPATPELFSAYVGGDDVGKRIKLNSYEYHRLIFRKFPVGDYALVVGHPGFRTLENSKRCLLDDHYSEILYLFHPRDRRHLSLNKAERRRSYDRIQALNWQVLEIQSSIESYLYHRKILPAKIITYDSSSSALLKAVLDSRVFLRTVEISNEEVQ